MKIQIFAFLSIVRIAGTLINLRWTLMLLSFFIISKGKSGMRSYRVHVTILTVHFEVKRHILFYYYFLPTNISKSACNIVAIFNYCSQKLGLSFPQIHSLIKREWSLFINNEIMMFQIKICDSLEWSDLFSQYHGLPDKHVALPLYTPIPGDAAFYISFTPNSTEFLLKVKCMCPPLTSRV